MTKSDMPKPLIWLLRKFGDLDALQQAYELGVAESEKRVQALERERDIYKAAFDTANNALMAASMQIEARKLIPEGKCE